MSRGGPAVHGAEVERYASLFRPRLDDPGAWPALDLDEDDLKRIDELRRSAATSTVDTLLDDYGPEPLAFGAAALVDRITGSVAEEDALIRTAMLILALDYYRSRASVPRAAPGGMTNSANRQRWQALRPYLVERLHSLLSAYVPGSLLSRAVYSTTTNFAHHDRDIERRVAHQFDVTNMFASVDVEVETPPAAIGGAARLNAESTAALSAARRSLEKADPLLLEVVRDPATSALSAQLVVAFLLDEPQPGLSRLFCYDPAHPDGPVILEIWKNGGDLRLYDASPDAGSAAPRGLRLIELADSEPPTFGVRRYVPTIIPWRLLWWIRRRLKTLRVRRAEQVYRASPLPTSPESVNNTDERFKE
ncbi:MAG: hypothetical protein AAFX10_03105 [Pseudomonadota bacterium]